MPAKSIAQQHLMQAAEHGADFPMAEKVRETMTHDQLHDFSIGSMLGKPAHVPPQQPIQEAVQLPMHPSAAPLLKGDTASIVGSNTNTLRQGGQSEYDAVRQAIQASTVGKPKGHANRHKNLGKWLHPKKGQ